MAEMSREDRLSALAQTLHTGWRKGADCKHAHPIWKLIQECEDGGWGEYLEWVDWCLGEVGYREVSSNGDRGDSDARDGQVSSGSGS